MQRNPNEFNEIQDEAVLYSWGGRGGGCWGKYDFFQILGSPHFTVKIYVPCTDPENSVRVRGF